jgi:hypothetical protein
MAKRKNSISKLKFVKAHKPAARVAKKIALLASRKKVVKGKK